MISRKYLIFLAPIALSACTTATPLPLDAEASDVAIVEGTSDLKANLLAGSTAVTINTVNGHSIEMDASKVKLSHGQYALAVSCQVEGKLGELYHDDLTINLDLHAGHHYKLVTEDPSTASLTETGISLTDSLTDREPSELQKALLRTGRHCLAFAYDEAFGTNPYPESVTLAPPGGMDDWHIVKSMAYDGQMLRESIRKTDSYKNWQMVIETGSWSKLVYPATADAHFKIRLSELQKDCPALKAKLLIESDDAVTYEFDGGACSTGNVAVELGHFFTDQYGVHRAAALFRAAPTETEKNAWLEAVSQATVTQQ